MGLNDQRAYPGEQSGKGEVPTRYAESLYAFWSACYGRVGHESAFRNANAPVAYFFNGTTE
jgi:hypothetical protein